MPPQAATSGCKAGQGWLLSHLLPVTGKIGQCGCEAQAVPFLRQGHAGKGTARVTEPLFTGAGQGGMITSLMPRLTVSMLGSRISWNVLFLCGLGSKRARDSPSLLAAKENLDLKLTAVWWLDYSVHLCNG